MVYTIRMCVYDPVGLVWVMNPLKAAEAKVYDGL